MRTLMNSNVIFPVSGFGHRVFRSLPLCARRRRGALAVALSTTHRAARYLSGGCAGPSSPSCIEVHV